MSTSNNYQLSGLLKKQAKARQQRALSLANQAMAMMREKGIDVRLFGSILTNDFKSHSDVDFLIISCPDEWRYTIESYIESIMLDIPFDVAYLDELPPEYKERLNINIQG
ncbi:MAG: nucleotidyltransferase domain-containing protein [Methylobacter sp.]|uniref:nucleotidyltransferase family protein n=1 Tax=Methylobacter sp. TaxID=2051955 RepID=UPI0025885540|nr:nucleotidyltransferase domain-containing protein [Methylobacter sp.]MCL7421778.1 nucleotidyltransferase domain-containing protein [Methylobacter sp.]